MTKARYRLLYDAARVVMAEFGGGTSPTPS